MNQALDTLGRATFHYIPPRRGTSPTAREIRWLKHIERHGPQSSVYLHDLTSDTHLDPDTSRRQLQKLRAGGLLRCPVQQRATERAEFNPYIYDLTPAGRTALADRGLAEGAVTPTGHWVHRYMTGCATSSIDIAATRGCVSYIPAHKILERSGTSLAVPLGHRRVIPDQLFGLDYGGRYRFFCLEADRGTEPGVSAAKRKSWRIMLEGYRRLLGDELYKSH
ncbi:MAG: replication-relaxation family protein, partial [Pseudomonadota bacterium]